MYTYGYTNNRSVVCLAKDNLSKLSYVENLIRTFKCHLEKLIIFALRKAISVLTHNEDISSYSWYIIYTSNYIIQILYTCQTDTVYIFIRKAKIKTIAQFFI